MAGEMIQVQSELSHLKRQKNQLEEKLKLLDSTVVEREKDLKESVLKLQEEKVNYCCSFNPSSKSSLAWISLSSLARPSIHHDFSFLGLFGDVYFDQDASDFD